MNDLSHEVGYDIISYSNGELTPVTSIDPDSQTIVTFNKTYWLFHGEIKVAQFCILVGVFLILQRASE